MLKIGLTGPTGSGKSTVTALMRQWGGVEILDADAIAHEVMESDACKAALAAAFSPAVLTPAGALEYLNGKSFRTKTPEFVEKYFPTFAERMKT